MRVDKTIALLDWNWMGHHPMYFTHFAAEMAQAGAQVVPFCAEPKDFLNRLERQDLPQAVRGRVANPQKIAGPVWLPARPALWRSYYQSWRFFLGLGHQLRAWESDNRRKIDLVFFACIYDRQFDHFGAPWRLQGYPWSGLYLHARSFRLPGTEIPGWWGVPIPETIFSGRKLRSVAVLDEGVVEPLKQLTGNKPVFVFPDITDESVGQIPQGLGTKLKTLASRRPLVSLSGYLQKTKGVQDFVSLARRPSLQHAIFVLAGSISWHGFSQAEREAVDVAVRQAPNISSHFEVLPEPEMNGLIVSSDVIFAAYRDFPNSSNLLTKAAVFERPILVSDGHLMAERVKTFALGEVASEGDLEGLGTKLEKMLAPDYFDNLRQRALWAEYRQAHSVEQLRSVIRTLLDASM